MKNETIALHGGFDSDPTTKAVAVPIYQTVAYSFDSAEHGAALFNLEAEGYRYTRIGNPTNAVLEQRVAMLEGGIDGLSCSSGQTALYYASLNVAEAGRNIISVPQLYGTTHTLFAHVLPKLGVNVRFAKSDRPEDLEALIDENTRAVFCETVGNPAGNVCDLEALAAVAHRAGVPLIVDNTVPTPILMRPIEYGADIVLHSLTKFLGGHGTSLGGIIVDSGNFDWQQHAARYPTFTTPDESYHGLVYTEHYGKKAFLGRCRSVYQRTMGAVLAPLNAFLLLQGIETVAAAHRSPRGERAACRGVSARRSACCFGELRRLPGQSLLPPGAEIPGRQGLLAADLRHPRRLRWRYPVLQCAGALQAAGESRRCEIAGLSSRLDHSPADVAGGAASRGHRAGNHPAQCWYRAHRRHPRRSRSGACRCDPRLRVSLA